MTTPGGSAASTDGEPRANAVTMGAPVIVNAPSAQDAGSHRATEAEEAQIIAAWRTGKYPTKERCLKALGLEGLNNAALWKRVKRALDRTSRRSEKPT